MKRLLPLVLLACIGCGPTRPENAIVTSMGCLELEHYGGWMNGRRVVIGDIIVRGDPDPDCPSIKKIEFWVYADTDADQRLSEGEILLHGEETYVAHTTSARIYETFGELDRKDGDVRYRIRVTNWRDESFESSGAAPE